MASCMINTSGLGIVVAETSASKFDFTGVGDPSSGVTPSASSRAPAGSTTSTLVFRRSVPSSEKVIVTLFGLAFGGMEVARYRLPKTQPTRCFSSAQLQVHFGQRPRRPEGRLQIASFDFLSREEELTSASYANVALSTALIYTFHTSKLMHNNNGRRTTLWQTELKGPFNQQAGPLP